MKKSQGFTLLEVLTSLFLLSILILSVTALQASVLRESRGAYYFHYAMISAENMCEYIASNSSHHAQYEKIWREQLHDVLPNASGKVAGSHHEYRVAINWGDGRSCDKNQMGVSGCVVLVCGQ